MYTPGVINGLTVSAGTGLSVSVSPGQAVVSDGLGGAYLCYFDAASTVTVAASGTRQIWVTVNQTTGQATVGAGTAPSAPYLVIGSVVTSSTGVSSVSNSRVMADSPAAPSSKYLLSSGGTVSGTVAATTLWGQQGVRFGNTATPTARHSVWMVGTANVGISPNGWMNLPLNSTYKSVSDYSVIPFAGGHFNCPVTGTYAVSAHAVFSATANTPPGYRMVQMNRNTFDSSAQLFAVRSDTVPGVTGQVVEVTASGIIEANAGDAVYPQAYTTSSDGLFLQVISGIGGVCCWASIRLIQAD